MDRFKQHYGKVMHTGIPRLSRMKPGATRFTLTDVAGNSIIFISDEERDQQEWEAADSQPPNTLKKAIAMAKRFRDYKNDDELAAKTLDVALQRQQDHSRLELAEALDMRMELAIAMGDVTKATECKQQLDAIGNEK